MKTNRLKQTILAASAAMGLALLAGSTQASENKLLWTFDTDPDVSSAWFSPWGGSTETYDGAAGTPSANGALYIVADSAVDGNMLIALGWYPNGNPDSSAHEWWTSNPNDLTTYTNVEFDLKWDTVNSTVSISNVNNTTISADPAAGIALWNVPGDNSSWTTIANFQVPNAASNGWVHIKVPIDASTPTLAGSIGLGFKKWVGSSAFGKAAFWIDNIQINAALVATPPPTMTGPVRAKAGLNLTAVSGPYNRENIKTLATTNETWIGKGAAGATYSFTVSQGVDGSAGAQFQNHIFLIPSPGTETGPDWTEPNLIFMDLESTTAGGTAWTFRYKTNLPNQNNMCYNGGGITVTLTNGGSGYASAPDVSFSGGSGFNSGLGATAQIDGTGVVTNIVVTNNWGFITPPDISFTGGGGSGAGASVALSGSGGIGALATLTETNPIYRTGTYTLSIKNDNQVTMTTPGGASTNFTVDLASMQMIGAAPVTAYFGCQAGNTAGIGQLSVLSNVTITGTDNPINDTFANGSTLDTNIWLKNSADANGVLLVPGDVPYDWVYWSTPANGYRLQVGSTLTTMTDATQNFQSQFGTKIGALAPASGSQQFYRAVKRVPYQLQVLLPGETNAPGTLTGKTGTPTPQSASANLGIVPVTVNMCDSAWYVVGSTDTIHITTTDGSATTPLDAALVNGTLTTTTFSFGSSGTFTVTASDVTNGAILPNTSSDVLVNP